MTKRWRKSPVPHSRTSPLTLALLCLMSTATPAFSDVQPEPAAASVPAPVAVGEVSVALRGRLEGRGETARLLHDAYAARAFAPVWVGDGRDPARLEALRATLQGASLDGLDPRRYLLASGFGNAASGDPETLAGIELQASLDFLRLIQDLRGSHPDSLRVRDSGMPAPPPIDARAALQDVAATHDIAGHAATYAPDNVMYRSMKKALLRYRGLQQAGGWPEFPAGRRLEPGDEHPRVAALRERLFATGDLIESDPVEGEFDAEVYDERLATAVLAFQRRHGLTEDAIVGPQTQAALRVDVDTRVAQIEANMERARWLPADMGSRHVVVNVPGFELEVFEDDQVVMQMAIIVGQRYRRTPVYSSVLTRLELNPRWYIPDSIARKDLLPKLQEDPYHMSSAGLRFYDRHSHQELHREEIDWWQMQTDGYMPVLMRQDPGPANALGRVKFLFDNPYAVYLHDTPARSLFDKNVRTFSSGCIRIERPLEMTEFLLRGSSRWDRMAIDDVLASGRQTPIQLPEAVGVHLVYRTAWMDEDGQVQFRTDIYGRDEYMAGKLMARGAAPPEGA